MDETHLNVAHADGTKCEHGIDSAELARYMDLRRDDGELCSSPVKISSALYPRCRGALYSTVMIQVG